MALLGLHEVEIYCSVSGYIPMGRNRNMAILWSHCGAGDGSSSTRSPMLGMKQKAHYEVHGISKVGSVTVMEVSYGLLLGAPQWGCAEMLVYGPRGESRFGVGTQGSVGRFGCVFWQHSQDLRG